MRPFQDDPNCPFAPPCSYPRMGGGLFSFTGMIMGNRKSDKTTLSSDYPPPLIPLIMKKVVYSLFTLLIAVSAKAGDPVNLLDGGLDHWKLDKDGAWEVKDGVLQTSEKPGGYIWSKEAFEDVKITLEYKTSAKCNSGLFFRTDPKNAVQGGFEIQIASNDIYDGKHIIGALYDAKEPTERAGKPDGEWNKMTVTCKGPKITVVLNGKTVIDVNIDDWDTANKNPDGTKNKFKTALKDLPRKGHIGFQYHGHPVWFRNVTVEKL